MADRSPQTISTTPLVATYNAATSGGTGDRVPPGVTLHVKNANAATVTITMVTPGTVDTDLAVADRTRTVTNGTEAFLKIPTNAAYHDVDGMVQMTWSVTSSVTFAVLTV
jgi:hypothetical protein